MAEKLNATFFALRKREQSGVLTRATIAFAIAAAVLIAIFAAVFWWSFAPVLTWYGQAIAASASGDTASMEAAGFPPQVFSLIGGFLLWAFPFYILCAAYEAACLRWMIHGEVNGFMGLSLGAQTWRVWGVYWMWFLLNIAFSIVMGIAMTVIVGIFAVSSGGDSAATGVAVIPAYLIQYGLMIYFGVRLAPAAAASIARRRFSFFHAWAVTRGRFWALLGSFALLYFIYAIVSVAIGAVWFVSVLGPNAPDVASAMGDPQRFSQVMVETMQAYLQSLTEPKNWIVIGVLQVISLVVMVVFYVAMYGVNARAAQAALEEGKIAPAT
jgi:hypothetical protein